jgi:hypothetical protein
MATACGAIPVPQRSVNARSRLPPNYMERPWNCIGNLVAVLGPWHLAEWHSGVPQRQTTLDLPGWHRDVADVLESRRYPTPEAALAGIRQWLVKHPLIVAFVVLAVGMVAMLLYASRDVDLLPTQRLALVVATVGLAGACVWIISWE